MQIIALVTLCATAILLATQTPIVASDLGRLLLVAAITTLVVCSPVVEAPVIDRLIAACIGGGALYYLIGMALGPVQFRIVSPPPRALIEARRGAYRLDCAVALA
jgi:hypothetical protein